MMPETADVDGDDVPSIANNQSVIGALLLAFTYANDAASIDVEAVCDDLDSCDTVWGSVTVARDVLATYRAMNYICTGLFLSSILFNSVLIHQHLGDPNVGIIVV